MINKKKFFILTVMLVVVLLPIRIFIEHKNNKPILFQHEELETSFNIQRENNVTINFQTKRDFVNISIFIYIEGGEDLGFFITIILVDKENYDIWNEGNFSYEAFIRESFTTGGVYGSILEEEGEYFLILDNKHSLHPKTVQISISSNNFYFYTDYYIEKKKFDVIFILLASLPFFILVTEFQFSRISRNKTKRMYPYAFIRLKRGSMAYFSILRPSNAPLGTTKFCPDCVSEISMESKHCCFCGYECNF